MSDEHNLLLYSIPRLRDKLELRFWQCYCIWMGQTKVAQRGCDPRMLKGWKTRKMNVHSKKWSPFSITFRYSSNQWLSRHTPEQILQILWSEDVTFGPPHISKVLKSILWIIGSQWSSFKVSSKWSHLHSPIIALAVAICISLSWFKRYLLTP